MNKCLSIKKIKAVIEYYYFKDLSIRAISKLLKVSRIKAHNLIQSFKNSKLSFQNINELPEKDFRIIFGYNENTKTVKYQYLINIFPEIYNNLTNSTLLNEWNKYKMECNNPYSYSQFCFLIKNILKNNGMVRENKKLNLKEGDINLLKKFKNSKDRLTWIKALTFLEVEKGISVNEISNKINKSVKTIKRWIEVYIKNDINAVFKRQSKMLNAQKLNDIKVKKHRVIEILHQSPKLFDINRTSWDLKNISSIYQREYKESISKSTISKYIRAEGFVFKKARKVLTSPDPLFREKLKEITTILQNLKNDEKFFSIDEYGPFSIKIQGGKTYTLLSKPKTFPQFQKSKGSLIITVALELSTNQIIHFYSNSKDTDEMIRLMNILLKTYKNQKCLYLSWDTASWHMSKKLYSQVGENNLINSTKVVLAPLPSSAQFLNVIESVFSGMAKAIIHNSNYESIIECKKSIDRYFEDRNYYFKKYPKKAGNKIWGNEIVSPEFNTYNNCKDSKWI